MTEPDLVLLHAGTMATLAGTGPLRGARAGELGLVPDGAVAVARGVIQAAGSTETVLRDVTVGVDTRIVDLDGRALLPGLVDAHTRLLYAGQQREAMLRRLDEGYDRARCAASTAATIAATSAEPPEALEAALLGRLGAMGRLGVTTVEVASGYARTASDQLRLLEVLARARHRARVRVVPTLLGLKVPPGEGGVEADVETWVTGLIPEVARRELAAFVELAVGGGGCSPAVARAVLEAARPQGLGLKVSAPPDDSGEAVALASEIGAVSLACALAPEDGDWAAMAASGTMMVLVPGSAFFLGLTPRRVREVVAAGVPVALGTDANPVTSPTGSLLAVMALATFEMGLTPAQALVAATRNAAHALGLGATTGSIEVGKSADLLAIDGDDPLDLIYRFATPQAFCVVARGRLLVDPQDGGGR